MYPIQLLKYMTCLHTHTHTHTHTHSATPMKVVIRFASGIAYCYNFCKKILLRVLHNFLPGEVVDLMCSVASVFLQHLLKIGFEKITQNLGGWVSSLSLSPRSRSLFTLSPPFYLPPSLSLSLSLSLFLPPPLSLFLSLPIFLNKK